VQVDLFFVEAENKFNYIYVILYKNIFVLCQLIKLFIVSPIKKLAVEQFAFLEW
jgi:hypothetical protein